MKKYVLGAFIGFLLLMSGCRDRQDGVHTEDTDLQKEKLTIMHVDAESPGFRKFIENAEKELKDRKSTRLNSSHMPKSRMPSSA